MNKKPGLITLAGMLLLAAAQPGLRAGSLRVLPIRVDLAARRPNATIRVTNIEASRITVQVGVYSWSQENGKDVLTPTDEVLSNPPMFTIEAGGTQILRLGLRRPASSELERSFRLILEEVPSAQPGDGSVRMLLRISVPVFVQQAGAARPNLMWSAQAQPDGTVVLAAENRGNQHVQIKELRATGSGHSAPDFVLPTFVYLLPGARQQWVIGAARAAGVKEFALQGQADGADVAAAVPVRVP